MAEVDFTEVLLRLFADEAPFSLADLTEMPRRQARKTGSGGRLSDGKTRGFSLLGIAQPDRGRAIPVACVSDSAGTMGQEGTSRNLEHRRAFGRVKGPLVLDREFRSRGRDLP